jgi:hypothetical protein
MLLPYERDDQVGLAMASQFPDDAKRPRSGASRFWRVACNTLLGSPVEKLRREISTIRPRNRFKLWMYRGLGEKRAVFKGFKHGTPKFTAQIHGSGHAVLETEPKLVAFQGPYFNHSWNHGLLQRFDLVQGLPGPSTRPVFQQFRLMENAPFVDQSQRASTQIAFQDRTIVYPNRGLLATILRVEMRRRMIVVVHGDDDAKESAYFGQSALPELR